LKAAVREHSGHALRVDDAFQRSHAHTPSNADRTARAEPLQGMNAVVKNSETPSRIKKKPRIERILRMVQHRPIVISSVFHQCLSVALKFFRH